MKKILLLLIFILSFPPLYAQKAEDKPLTKVVFTPQWLPQSQFAGYYVAEELGYYKECGLDLEILHPYVSMKSMDMLKHGICDIASTMLVEALPHIDNDFDIMNIMQIIPHSTMLLLSHTPLDNSIHNLEGKTLGTWKAGYATSLKASFKNRKIDVHWVEFLSGVNVFLSKSVDATTCMAYNEILSINESGYDIKDNQIIKVSDLGYDVPEDGVYTTSAFAKKNPEIIKKFRNATMRGWLWVAQNKEEALKIVMKKVQEENVTTNIYHQRRMLDVLLEYGVADINDNFTLKEESYNDACKLLRDAGLIEKTLPYNTFVFQPKEGKEAKE